MLSRISIRDIVLIDRLDIDFADGLAVLTGETGAGKSILLDAFALALGARGDQALVRQGAEQGQVTAVFEVKRAHPARALLSAHNWSTTSRPRTISFFAAWQFSDGRTRAFVNDQPVSVQVMKELGAALVEIHGQHDERALVDAATHRRLLDAFGALEADAVQVQALWEARRAAVEAADAPSRRRRTRQARRRLAAPCCGGARQAQPADRRGNRIGRPAHRHDAGRESGRRPARRPRRDRRRQFVRAGARRRRPPAGAARGAGAEPGRAGGEGARCRAYRAGGNSRPSRAGFAHRRFRSGRTGAYRGAPVRSARGGTQIQRAGGRAGGAGGQVQSRHRADRRRRGSAQGAYRRRRESRSRLLPSPPARCRRRAPRRRPRSTRRSMPSSSRSSWNARNFPPRSSAMPPPPGRTASTASSSGCRPIRAPSPAR